MTKDPNDDQTVTRLRQATVRWSDFSEVRASERRVLNCCKFERVSKMSMNAASVANLNRGGRKPGVTNLKTRAKDALASAAVAELAGQLTDDAVAALLPLDILLAIARASYRAGDLATARVAAEAAAPYCHSKCSATPNDPAIPAELMPDPEPCNDEPGPDHPIL